MKIAFFDAKEYERPFYETLFSRAGHRVKFFSSRLERDTARLAHGCEGVCLFVNDLADAPVIDRLQELGVRFLCLRCAGFNNVDVSYAKEKLAVAHVPAYSPHAVAEHAAALLLSCLRRIPRAYHRTRDFNFRLDGLMGSQLHGKTAGIVGMGRIGSCFARICQGLGMRVVAFDKAPVAIEGVSFVSVEELFSQSDVISLHCPLTRDTYHLVNAQRLETAKDGVILVNTSRGALVDTHALLAGIRSGKVGAACLDVYEEESDFFFRDYSESGINDDTLALLLSAPNVLLTSHQAFLTDEALDAIAKTTVDHFSSLEKTGDCAHRLC